MGAWSIASGTLHLVGACTAAALAVWMLSHRGRLGAIALPVVVALSLSSAWALCAAAFGTGSDAASFAETFRNLAWLFFIWRKFGNDGRDDLVKPVRPMVFALGFVELVHGATILILHHRLQEALAHESVFMAGLVMRLFLTIGGLVLVHNLFVGASPKARRALRWPAVALALQWLFDLNLYTVAYLGVAWPMELAALRGLVLALATALLIPMLAKGRDNFIAK